MIIKGHVLEVENGRKDTKDTLNVLFFDSENQEGTARPLKHPSIVARWDRRSERHLVESPLRAFLGRGTGEKLVKDSK